MPRRARAGGSFEPNLTPLLDVVLQLITFFMMLIHFGSQVEGAARSVRLPVAAAALPGSDIALERLVAAIDAGGRLLDEGGTPLDPEAARDWWAARARERREQQRALGGPAGELPTVVVVRADREASYGAVRRALAEAQSHGFARFTLVVVREIAP
jgi:biopolymer transport protein ExbD